ncbi:T9SS type A sorting domain-containing protein [candidate division KSB1 bacterium]
MNLNEMPSTAVLGNELDYESILPAAIQTSGNTSLSVEAYGTLIVYPATTYEEGDIIGYEELRSQQIRDAMQYMLLLDNSYYYSSRPWFVPSNMGFPNIGPQSGSDIPAHLRWNQTLRTYEGGTTYTGIPETPTNFDMITTEGYSPEFVWDACDGAQEYEIYKKGSGSWFLRATTTNIMYIDRSETVDYDRDAIEKEYYVKAVNAFGSSSASNIENIWVEPLSKTSNLVPDKFGLDQNYPNPFNPVTKIMFQLPETSEVKITIYNVMGNVVETLVDGYASAGYYEAEWNASDYASGIYFVRMAAGSFTEMRKMTLVK